MYVILVQRSRSSEAEASEQVKQQNQSRSRSGGVEQKLDQVQLELNVRASGGGGARTYGTLVQVRSIQCPRPGSQFEAATVSGVHTPSSSTAAIPAGAHFSC